MARTNDTSSNELLSVTAFMSALAHAAIILLVTFEMPDFASRANTDNFLEVVLVSNNNNQQVDDADLISSENNLGGGDDERDGSTPLPYEAVNPSEIQSVAKTAKRVEQNQISPDQMLRARNSDIALAKLAPTPTELRMDGNKAGRDKVTTKAIQLDRERLAAKINQNWENYQKRPRKKYVGPTTKGHGAAKYLDDWRKRVVAVGNANYPVQIKARKLHGTLIMTIEINSNGTIHDVKVLQPSPHKLLNDAALRIVRDASPFEAFPDEEYFKNTNILVITRAIHFLPDNRIDSSAQGRG